MSEGYKTVIPCEKLRVNSVQELGSLAVILQTECDNNGRVFGEIELVDGPYGGLMVEVPGLTPQEVNEKTVLLDYILKTFK